MAAGNAPLRADAQERLDGRNVIGPKLAFLTGREIIGGEVDAEQRGVAERVVANASFIEQATFGPCLSRPCQFPVLAFATAAM